MDWCDFFEDKVDGLHCGDRAYGMVWANSGTINCDQCDDIIVDARDTSGTVVILELEGTTVQ